MSGYCNPTPHGLVERSVTRWVIVGRHGLYTGQWLTRKAAICAHVNDKGVPITDPHPDDNRPFIAPVGEKALLAGWPYWRKQGDRAVKATITWEEPST